jgi:Bacterial EndoU nuclease
LGALSNVYSDVNEARKKLEILTRLDEIYNDVRTVRRWTYPELAGQRMTIDLDHVFLLEGKWKTITINGKVQEILHKITGLHSDFGEKLARNSNLVIKKIRMGPSGIYEAEVGLAGIFKRQPSTFFPKIWDDEKVVQKVLLEAAANISKPPVKKVSELLLTGQVAEGFEIEMAVNFKGKIKSFYPILE